ncbi:class I SAM-dependent methyltransferase [uncultured Clostridium sp.]|jgi:tRNA (adenine22-N1)-methyltransferase|uniref:tRNA (adenine(22)-N(1))-methyltransferase n=1 Tax=uncultured Clostridium sp. TaxID=59620 RepID=UPI00260B47A6|nr:class I SAM-dependent methyltransferase [uncultured Clostridium sp.]
MELSIRLKTIADSVDKCESVADIGTDHGYVPIYLVERGICERAIASDINKGPISKAKMNISFEGLSSKIDCYLGGGLKPLKVNEVEGIVIAGMGGNLTRDILLADMKKVQNYKFMILQPAQNPEVLREFLYSNEYEIIDEDLILDEGTYYELFKVKYNKEAESLKFEDEIYYEVSPVLLKKKHPLINDYLDSKISRCEKVITHIKEDTQMANAKKQELRNKVNILEQLKIK